MNHLVMLLLLQEQCRASASMHNVVDHQFCLWNYRSSCAYLPQIFSIETRF